MSMTERTALLDRAHEKFSLRKQCQLLNLNRSSTYYQSCGESEYNLMLMRLLDEEYTRYPFKGVLKMVNYLNDLGHQVNHKRVRRLLRHMGIMAIYPKKRTTICCPEHKKYPYLLKGLAINKANQVWCTDITYLRLSQGFAYLVAVMDWYSRYILSWRLSNSLDSGFCVETLEDAILLYGLPEIFNSDQGSQFTSNDFTDLLATNEIKISMAGRGRAFDNIFIERLWRTVKYEEVYLYDYASMSEAKRRLRAYFKFYNFQRDHQGLENRKPAEVYYGRIMPVDYMNSVDNSLL